MATQIDNATFRKGIREDGTVEGYVVETYYVPCKGIGDDEAGFLRVLIDDDATDLESRIPHSALIAAGWAKESVAPELLEALEGLLNALPSGTTHPAIKKARAALAKASA